MPPTTTGSTNRSHAAPAKLEAFLREIGELPAAKTVSRFGSTTDAREAGRKGGLASVQARKLAKQRRLEAKIAETKNGAALVKLLELERRRTREIEQAIEDGRRQAAFEAERAGLEVDGLLAEKEWLMAERDKPEDELDELQRVRDELRAQLEQEADAAGLIVVDEEAAGAAAASEA